MTVGMLARSLALCLCPSSTEHQQAPADEEHHHDAADDPAGCGAAPGVRGPRGAARADGRGDTVTVACLGGGPDLRVVVAAVLDQPDAARVGLWLQAGEPVGPDRLSLAGL